MNGLYDASFDGAPVLAITGTTFHDLRGTRFMQGVDTDALMQQVAQYNVQVTGPAHALIVANRACVRHWVTDASRTSLSRRMFRR